MQTLSAAGLVMAAPEPLAILVKLSERIGPVDRGTVGNGPVDKATADDGAIDEGTVDNAVEEGAVNAAKQIQKKKNPNIPKTKPSSS